MAERPKLAVWKFASCDGCQLQILDLEDDLLLLAERLEIAYFVEATRREIPPPYDISIVEGSITTPDDAERIRRVRESSKFLITVGACATAGGIQALRNYADVDAYLRIVYASPEYISTLKTSTAIADHVDVDFELRGCPINKAQLLEVVSALLVGRVPRLPSHSVCFECKARGNICVMVAKKAPCLGPVTHAGCDAICPSYARACFGCYGPADTLNVGSLADEWRRAGVEEKGIVRALRTFNAWAPGFRTATEDADE